MAYLADITTKGISIEAYIAITAIEQYKMYLEGGVEIFKTKVTLGIFSNKENRITRESITDKIIVVVDNPLDYAMAYQAIGTLKIEELALDMANATEV